MTNSRHAKSMARFTKNAEAMKALAPQQAEPVQEPCKACGGTGEVETGIGMLVCGECHGITYTTPPQRPWVGLTDEQLDEIAVVARRGNLHDLRIAIEAAHNIKEQP